MTQEDYADIVARITALEMFNRITLTAIANSAGEGSEITTLERMERDTFTSLQNASRPIGDFADEVWERMVDHMRLAFKSARQRFGEPNE